MQTFELRCRIPRALANKLTTFGESQGLTLREALIVVLAGWEPPINAPLIDKQEPKPKTAVSHSTEAEPEGQIITSFKVGGGPKIENDPKLQDAFDALDD